MDTTPDPARAIKVSGEILFALCLAVALSIYLLNSSLADQRDLRERQWKRHEALTEMVDRLHSFRAKDGALFERLAASSLTIAYYTSDDEARYPGLVRRVRSGPNSWTLIGLPEQRLWEIEEASHVFGEKAGQAFAAWPSQDDRVREFRTLVTQAFKSDGEAALYLNNEVVPKLVAIDTPAEWDRIAWWIANGQWPEPSGGVTGDGGPGVTFGKRLGELPSEFSDRFYVYRLMRLAPHPLSADQELFNLWKESYIEQRISATQSPRLAVPSYGLSISAEAVVAAAAPILVLFQLLFLVHWERRSIPSTADLGTFAFPSYACPSDPLNGPAPKTLGEVVQRLVWALFLVLPIGLLAVGLLTRYDILYPLDYFGNPMTTTLFQAEMQARSEDLASSIIDWITFACITLSALTVLSITQSRSTLKVPSTRAWRLVALGGWFIAVVSATSCIYATWSAFNTSIAPLVNASEVSLRVHYLSAFGLLWSLCFGVACQRRARFLALLSLAGLAVFVLHFVKL